MPERLYTIPARPKNDEEHLELIARILFVTGFRYDIVEQRWPKIRRAFENFSIGSVTRMNVDRLKEADGMIRNGQKIQRIIDNAGVCRDLVRAYGSMRRWVASVVDENRNDVIFRPTLREECQRLFTGIGETTSAWLAHVYAEGKPTPERIYADDHRRTA